MNSHLFWEGIYTKSTISSVRFGMKKKKWNKVWTLKWQSVCLALVSKIYSLSLSFLLTTVTTKAIVFILKCRWMSWVKFHDFVGWFLTFKSILLFEWKNILFLSHIAIRLFICRLNLNSELMNLNSAESLKVEEKYVEQCLFISNNSN